MIRTGLLSARSSSALYFFAEFTTDVFNGLPPVEVTLNHVVAVEQEPGQVVVRAADRSIRQHAVRPPGFVLETIEAVDQTPADPDAILLDLEVAAENARKQDDGW